MCVAFLLLDTFVKTLWGVIFYSNSNAHFFPIVSYNSLISSFFCFISRLYLYRMKKRRRTNEQKNVKDLVLYQIKVDVEKK